MMQLANLALACDGQLMGVDVDLRGVTTDSRGDCQGMLFVALKGERFDAHDFVAQAEQRGAVALLVSQAVETELPLIRVADTGVALMQIAAWWRAQFVLPIIGITGSVGKTTVKEMTAAIFAELGRGLVTQGNLNNEIGMPLTLLRMSPEDRYAVIEMGMNHAGEIARLTRVARPTITLINNAAAAHLEGLGSVAAVAQAKGEILQGLSDDGVAVLNADDPHIELWRALAGSKRVMTFALDADADVRGEVTLHSDACEVQISTQPERFSVHIGVPGRHTAANALAAATLALAANVPASTIVAGLEKYRPAQGRLNLKQLNGLCVMDDTYNANPASMGAAIEVLAARENTALLVGDMAELGENAADEHFQIGQLAADKGIQSLLACGEFAKQVVQGFGERGVAFDHQQQLLEYLQAQPILKGNVLVKGSRSAKMEKVVAYLIEQKQTQLNVAEGGH